MREWWQRFWVWLGFPGFIPEVVVFYPTIQIDRKLARRLREWSDYVWAEWHMEKARADRNELDRLLGGEQGDGGAHGDTEMFYEL